MTEQTTGQSFKRKLDGVVVGHKNDKTAIVNVTRRFKHRTYNKFISQRKRYHAHDADNKAQLGDWVTIIESRPYSKLKKWKLLTIH